MTATGSSMELLKLILDHTTDVDASDRDGVTALHMAIKKGNLDYTELLFAHGVKTNTPDSTGAFPIHYAARIALAQ